MGEADQELQPHNRHDDHEKAAAEHEHDHDLLSGAHLQTPEIRHRHGDDDEIQDNVTVKKCSQQQSHIAVYCLSTTYIAAAAITCALRSMHVPSCSMSHLFQAKEIGWHCKTVTIRNAITYATFRPIAENASHLNDTSGKMRKYVQMIDTLIRGKVMM
jgi:hypothetical protein